MKVNVIMPMLGDGTRMKGVQDDLPKPLKKFPDGDLFFIKALSSLEAYEINKLTLIVRLEHYTQFTELRDTVKQISGCDDCVIIPYGPTSCHYDSFKVGFDYWRNDALFYLNNLIVIDCDIYAELPVWEETDSAASLFTFNDSSVIANKSYVMGWGNKVTNIAEKKRISNQAVFGAYLFRDIELLAKIMDDSKRELTNMSDLYREIILQGSKVTKKTIYNPMMFGTTKEYKQILKKYGSKEV